MTSRLSQRRSQKQEKYKRHIASLTQNDSNVSKDDGSGNNNNKSEDRNPPIQDNKTRNVADYPLDEIPKIQQNQSDGAFPYRRRSGRSLTRAYPGTNSRSSSNSSNNSSEPGRIVPSPRTGRSHSRSDRRIPKTRSLSGMRTAQMPSSTTPIEKATRSSKVDNARARSKSRSNSSEPSKTRPETMRVGRSPFTKLVAEKKGGLTRKPKGISKYDLRPTSSTISQASSTISQSPSTSSMGDIKPTTSTATSVPSLKPAKSIASSAATSVPSLKPATSIHSSDPSVKVVSNKSAPSEVVVTNSTLSEESPDAVNVSVLSQENVKKHTDVNDVYEDPPLQELESEVTVNTDLENELPTQSLLATLATSPVKEVVSPVISPVSQSNEESTNENVDQRELALSESSEEKKEDDNAPNSKAWDLSNPEFSKFSSSREGEFKPVSFDNEEWESEKDTKFTDSAFKDNTEKANEKGNSSKDQKSPDMFDTSSWAAGTISGFSNTSMSKVEVDVTAEKNFVAMMIEEMKFRAITDEERKMMFDANAKILQAEEQAELELKKVQKDDEPLITGRSDSNSVEGSEANTGVSLEDRLKSYNSYEVDEESSVDDRKSENSESSDDEEVKYVGQDNEEEVPEADNNKTSVEEHVELVSSNDVPTLGVAASAASGNSSNSKPPPSPKPDIDDLVIPSSLSELKRQAAPPPPPPPGKKKKKKKKKSKSKKDSSKTKNIPLIAPPSEEKLKTWKGNESKSDYFEFKPFKNAKKEDASKSAEADDDDIWSGVKESPDPSQDDASKDDVWMGVAESRDSKGDVWAGVAESKDSANQNAASEEIEESKDNETTSVKKEDEKSVAKDGSTPELVVEVQSEDNSTTVMHTSPTKHLWQQQVDDAMGLVEQLELECDNGNIPEIGMFPTPLLSDDVPSASQSEDTAEPPPPPKEEAIEEAQSEDTAEPPPPPKEEAIEEAIEIKKGPPKPLKIDVEDPIESTMFPLSPNAFASPQSVISPKANIPSENRKASSSARSVLTDSNIAAKAAMASSAAANTFEEKFKPKYDDLVWFSKEVLATEFSVESNDMEVSKVALKILEDKENFNCMCRFVAENINQVSMELNPHLKPSDTFDEDTLSRTFSATDLKSLKSTNTVLSITSSGDSDDKSVQRLLLKPIVISDATVDMSSKYLAANFVSFLFMSAKLANLPSPFGDSNPFLAMIVESSLETIDNQSSPKSAQELIFEQLDGKVEKLVEFVRRVKDSCDKEMKTLHPPSRDPPMLSPKQPIRSTDSQDIPTAQNAVCWAEKRVDTGKRFIAPDYHPSPFESSIIVAPRIVAAVLSFLGDPVAVSKMKEVNQKCQRIIVENEHVLMQDAVRVGGIDARFRPSFWLYVALEKSDADCRANKFSGAEELNALELSAEEGKWHHVIQRDVDRSFGNMPPHKTGATFQSDSIVPALVTWGQNRLMKRGVKGGGEPMPTPDIGDEKHESKRKSTTVSSPPWKADNTEENADTEAENKNDDSPKDTVSDWGAVSPKGSFVADEAETSTEDIALCGNHLSADAKVDLQNKLSYILHTLAASYEDIGYCQGMDYVVAHLLRNLQDTIRFKAANNSLPPIISTASTLNVTEDLEALNKDIDSNHVVEEAIVRVMDTFFGNYNLKHMYWPELRCLKTCCRVFERLIQIKLPVLADHFEHHDLNVGLFAIGWFQTLFLYLPSMPSATVCRMWDIWLVERSFKIFFRVGTAILFLSQPILLNHELEGMMTYLNTIPDATLLRPDILIPCALNIKVTNRLLQELEDEITKSAK